MALTFLYRDLDATDTDITPYVVLRFGQNPQGMAENAEERSVGAWDLEIEDNGVLDLHAQRTFYVLEDDTDYTDNVLWVGQTFDKHSVRGDTWRTGPGRVYTLNLIDLNTLLERRVIQAGDDPNRPEETDVERMLWLQGLGYIGVTDDWISTAAPVDMDAVDYTGRMASEVIEDCMGQSGKNSFMFRDPDTDTFAVYYGDSSADTDILTSDIRLSNVLSDVDNVTTFEVNLDADQWEANSRIYSGIFASYDGGGVYQENATTVANFSHRDTTVSWPDVKTATKANARAIRYLDDIGTEEVRITAALEVPSTQVGLFPHAGYRLQARFSHFPLFAVGFTWMRILSRNTTLIGPNRYRIQYELSPGASRLVSCATQNPPDVAEHGPFDEPSYLHPDDVVTTPGTPTTFPAVILIGFAGFGGPGGDAVVGSAEYETLYAIPTEGVMSVGGYQALTSGSPAEFIPQVGPPGLGWAHAFTSLSLNLYTSETAPVQTASQEGSGGSVTFTDPPTAGNMLVMYRITVTNGTGGDDAPGVEGWTKAYSSDGPGGVGILDGGNPIGIFAVWTRCVVGDEGSTFGVGDATFAHWSYVSEWAFT